MNSQLQALYFAKGAHGGIGQRRKYTNEPYIVHPVEVAALVKSVYGSDDMISAAYLHDVVEDTEFTQEDILYEFGSKIAEYVYFLTDKSKPEDGNRAARKAIDRAHISKAPPEVKTIKLADLISNTGTIVKYDENFAKVYLAEKRKLLKVLKAGDSGLYSRAHYLAREQ